MTSTAAVADAGGLVGNSSGGSSSITASYCDAEATGLPDCVGSESGGSVVTVDGKPTEELQPPAGYEGIYANWNLDLDGNPAADDNPWRFGGRRNYPVLWHNA